MSEEIKNTAAAEETAAEETAAAAAAEESTQPDPLQQLQQELAAEKDKYLRLAAEYDNYRKRTAKEKESIYNDGKLETIAKFLDVYDNLERGLAQFKDDAANRQGMEMIIKQFLETMAKLGVTEMSALNEAFDPERHNAVMHVEDEAYGENTVIEVFQKGFMLGERVLRFATVKVAN